MVEMKEVVSGMRFESLAVAQFTRCGGHPLQPLSTRCSK
jgi:hypothetical protein